MVIKFPCKICNKGVVNNNHAIQCDKCHSWIHIKCNKINLSTYRYLQFSNIFTPGIGLNVMKILFHSLIFQMMNYMKPTLVKEIKFKALTRKQNFQNQISLKN